MNKKEKAKAIIDILKQRYDDAACALHYAKDYELMIAVRLSAQCTDARVNLVTPALFAAYPTLEAMAAADIADVENYVRSCGFYKHKARDIVLACQMLLTDYGGKVPGTMEELLRLPGVGRKTANLLLGDLYAIPGSVVCDTHCIRICGRLGLSTGKEPEKVEQQLRKILPPEESSDFCHRIVLFGRVQSAGVKQRRLQSKTLNSGIFSIPVLPLPLSAYAVDKGGFLCPKSCRSSIPLCCSQG